LRRLLISIPVVLLAALAWRYRDAPVWRELAGSPPPPAPRIEFGNGSSRDATTTTRVVPRSTTSGPRRLHQLAGRRGSSGSAASTSIEMPTGS
jgi:hypothetical protein